MVPKLKKNSRARVPEDPLPKLEPALDRSIVVNTTKKYTSVMIRVCHSRSRFLSCMYIHDKFMKNEDSHTCAVVEVFHDITKIIIMEVSTSMTINRAS